MAATLHEAARSGDVAKGKELLDLSANINECDKLHRTPLHLAAWANHTAFIQLLVSNKKLDVHAEAADKMTALHFAAQSGCAEGCALLLDRKAKVSARGGKKQLTPLHLAAQKGHFEVVKLLVSRGAALDAKTSDNKVPSDLANDFAVRKLIRDAEEEKEKARAEAERKKHRDALKTTANEDGGVDQQEGGDSGGGEGQKEHVVGDAEAGGSVAEKRPAEPDQEETQRDVKKRKVALSFQEDYEE